MSDSSSYFCSSHFLILQLSLAADKDPVEGWRLLAHSIRAVRENGSSFLTFPVGGKLSLVFNSDLGSWLITAAAKQVADAEYN